MDMVRFGRGIRALRIRRGWRQSDLAAAAGVSQSVVARIERGLGGRVTPETLAMVAHALSARIDVRLSWHGEGLERLIDHDHAALVEKIARWLTHLGWDVRPEVSFWIRGERGSVDLLAWHEPSHTLLVIEVKSVVPDVQATLFTLDRKGRLAAEIAANLGWRPRVSGRLLVIGGSRTSRRRVAAHSATFAAVLPHRFLEVRRFLAAPDGREPLRGLIFVTLGPQATHRHRQVRHTATTRA